MNKKPIPQKGEGGSSPSLRPTLRNFYTPHARVPFINEGPSRAKQSFKEECDVNNIMAKYQTTGLLEHVNEHKGDYGDFSDSVDYQSALNVVLIAEKMFDTLPSSIRNTFSNDPAQFLAFVENPANRPAMQDMGLLTHSSETPVGISEEPAGGSPPASSLKGSDEPTTPPKKEVTTD